MRAVDRSAEAPSGFAALSARGNVINDFVWPDGPRQLDYFTCDSTGCTYEGTVRIESEVTLREPRESVWRMSITNVAGAPIKPRLLWYCRATNGSLPDSGCGETTPDRWNSPSYIGAGQTFAITANPAIAHTNSTFYFDDYHFQWEVEGRVGLVDTRAFDGDCQSSQFRCDAGASICVSLTLSAANRR